MPSGPSLLNDSDSVQIAPLAAFELDAHIHGDAEGRVYRPLRRVRLHDRRADLIGEEIDGVRGVVPEQMVGPRARLAERVHVGAPEEIGLHVHLLDMEFVGENSLVDELVARVEAAGVADHGDETGLLLRRDNRLGIPQTVGEGDLDLHVLAGLQAPRLSGRRASGSASPGHGVEARELQRLGELHGRVADPVFVAASPVLSISRPTSEITSIPSISLIASRCLRPKAPTPASATLMVLVTERTPRAEDRLRPSLRGA